MRHFGTALAVVLVTLTASPVLAQDKAKTIPLNIGNGQTITMTMTPPTEDEPSPAPGESAADLAKILPDVGLSPAQKESIAKLDKARAANSAKYSEATYVAAVRALLTEDQRTKVDAKLKAGKKGDK